MGWKDRPTAINNLEIDVVIYLQSMRTEHQYCQKVILLWMKVRKTLINSG